MNGFVRCEKNQIFFSGDISDSNLRRFCGFFYQVIEKKQYKDIDLDFSRCNTVFESFMLPLVAETTRYRAKGVDFTLKIPEKEELNRLFLNTNWAYWIDPDHFEETCYEGPLHLHVPAIRFVNADQQSEAVNRVMEVIVNAMVDVDRKDLRAIEWSLNELMDNVLSHAQSSIGGFVQASTFSETKRVEFIVADTGIGIPTSLRINDQKKALQEAIKEGVTHNRKTNQGNGLYGSQRVASLSGGTFDLHSYKASLFSKSGTPDKVILEKIPYPGTIVRCLVDCTNPHLLEDALKLKVPPDGRLLDSLDGTFDFIDAHFTDQDSEQLVLKMNEYLQYLGTREAGAVLRNKIKTLLANVPPGDKLRVDFTGVNVISSSVADEVFGMLFQELGPMTFMARLEMTMINSTVRSLIDRAIVLRTVSNGRG